jgi:uncharacterized protein YjbJ (UPF0337 family)
MDHKEPIKKDWAELKSKVKARFSKLTDDAVESLNGNLDSLPSKIEKAYGFAKEIAEKEIRLFKETLHAATEPVPVRVDSAASGPLTEAKTSNTGIYTSV